MLSASGDRRRGDSPAPDRVKDFERGHMLSHVVNAKIEAPPASAARSGHSPDERALNPAFDQ